MRFGRLVVVEKSPAPRMWHCVCDCGNSKLANGSSLRRGLVRSCGCLASEASSAMGSNPEFIAKRSAAVTKHGHKKKSGPTPEYRTWLGMKRRCYDTKCKDFPGWGGRGISVCDRWNGSFDAFLQDIGTRPSAKHSIDRLDPNKNYSPENCRWADQQQQGGENKRTNIQVTVDGISFGSIAEACRHFGVSITAAWMRIQSGIDPATAVSHVGRMKSRRDKRSYIRRENR